MFKTETHIHTRPVSSCSKLTPTEMVNYFKEAGYDTVIISDHFSAHHFKKLGEELTFSQKVDMLYDSYLEAKAEGDRIGLTVLFSVELSFQQNHYLLYGVTREFLKLREDIFDIPTLDELYEHLKAHGITIIQAHPNRDDKCTPHPHHVDGFEINCGRRHDNHNDRILALAREYDLPLTIGADCHRQESVGITATLTEEKLESIEQYLDLLFARKLILSVGPNALLA
jgi:predicted metal-dependent phosphoesterase TrpH